MSIIARRGLLGILAAPLIVGLDHKPLAASLVLDNPSVPTSRGATMMDFRFAERFAYRWIAAPGQEVMMRDLLVEHIPATDDHAGSIRVQVIA